MSAPLTLGTAGHIDHGKTALIGALTGRDTDRLPEERERGISIDLGYAPLDLPSGRRLSVVDVPGHERFVRTMVAGATGVDLFLLCVAADDGVMPQTREHLAVLRHLGVDAGVVAVTKADLGDPAAVAERLPELECEPAVGRSVAAGCALVCFSGDKLLGGPQAGLVVGRSEAVDRCRSHPLTRALRVDKLSLAALEATLRTYRDPDAALRELPVLRMLTAAGEELHARAEGMRARIARSGVEARVIESSARVGGGALPLLELRGPACAVDPSPLALDELARRLRAGEPPVVARAHEGWLLLDPRTLDDESAGRAADAVAAVLRR